MASLTKISVQLNWAIFNYRQQAAMAAPLVTVSTDLFPEEKSNRKVESHDGDEADTDDEPEDGEVEPGDEELEDDEKTSEEWIMQTQDACLDYPAPWNDDDGDKPNAILPEKKDDEDLMPPPPPPALKRIRELIDDDKKREQKINILF